MKHPLRSLLRPCSVGRPTPAGPRHDRSEHGGMLVMLMGFVAVIVSMVMVGIDSTNVYLARIETLNVADAAARGAADALSEEGYYADVDAPLDPQQVQREARDAMERQVPSRRIEAWTLDAATPSGDGRQATVRVTSQVHFPVTDVVRAWVPHGTTVTVESTARGSTGSER